MHKCLLALFDLHPDVAICAQSKIQAYLMAWQVNMALNKALP